jgi:hypothetical protein
VTPPTASLSAPTGYLSDVATARMNTDDDQGIATDLVFIDDRLAASADNPAAGQDLSFDTRGLSDGPHTIHAVTRDRGGNEATTARATITVDNNNPLGLLTNPTWGATVTAPFLARVYTTDVSGIMGTFLVANDQIVGGYVGGGWGQAVVPVTKTGQIRVVAITVDNAGKISGTNMAIVNAKVARKRSRR